MKMSVTEQNQKLNSALTSQYAINAHLEKENKELKAGRTERKLALADSMVRSLSQINDAVAHLVVSINKDILI